MDNNLLDKYEIELENTKKAMTSVREQINILNKKGEELATHATYLSGKVDALKEILQN